MPMRLSKYAASIAGLGAIWMTNVALLWMTLRKPQLWMLLKWCMGGGNGSVVMMTLECIAIALFVLVAMTRT